MSFIEKLKERWNLQSARQVFVILIVFALTGFTVLFLKKPVISLFTEEGVDNTWFTITYYILILPIYNLILLFYGFIFGQFHFFWEFEKKSLRRIVGRK